MKKVILSLLIFAGLVSCQNKNQFTIQGTVENAQDEMLYLEHTGLLKTTALDSVKLSEDGKFTLKNDAPQYPDFYQLRIKNKTIALAVDSIETITVTSDLNSFSSNYTIEGSYNSERIKELRLSAQNIQSQLSALKPELSQTEQTAIVEKLEKDIEEHKNTARSLILQNPMSTTAYFALFQQINDSHFFTPYDKEDYKYYAAVATAYHTFMPEYERSKNLHAITMNALKEKQREEKRAQGEAALSELMKNAKGYIDIALPDRKGTERKLSDLEGKVVLIDFSAYEMPESIDYTFALRDLYEKHSKQGFEIYQVSLDQNKLLWEISTENIPWICVRDLKGPDTEYVMSYNLTGIPTTFLMDKKGNIVSRSLKLADLDKEISKLIK